MLQYDAFESAYAHQSGELAVADEGRVEGLPDEYLAPVGATVSVLYENFYIEVMKRAVGVRGFALLFIAQAVLGLSVSEILRGYETVTQDCLGVDKDVIHGGLPGVR
jgi:hypothetical protein